MRPSRGQGVPFRPRTPLRSLALLCRSSTGFNVPVGDFADLRGRGGGGFFTPESPRFGASQNSEKIVR